MLIIIEERRTEMSFSEKEKVSLKEMLNLCHEKFGELSWDQAVCSRSCDGCTGGCEGHGASIWDCCDIK